MVAARRLLLTSPVSGARAPSVRMQVASAAGTYLRRFSPDAELIGVERPLGAGVADLVWSHDGSIVIDEIKSGTCVLGDPPLVAQVARFLDGGRGEWGEAFSGVRLVPLSKPSGAHLIVGVANGLLVPADCVPDWLVVR